MERNKFYQPPERFYSAGEKNLYGEQEKRWEIVRVTDFRALEKTRSRRKLGFDPKIKKIGRLLGLDIWVVNGEKIRTKAYVDFTCGGHAYRYLYVPLNEIWIDNALKGGDVIATIWHELTERRYMARGWSYNEAHDFASRAEIKFRQEGEFVLPVANFDQIYPYSCGATAMRMVLEYFGKNIPEKRLVRMIKATSDKGADMKDMASAAKSLGFQVRWRQGWTPEQAKKTLKSGLPVIVNFQEKPELGEGHYVVIVGYTQDGFIFSDPNNGDLFWKQKIKDFMKRWYELEDKTVREGIVIYK